MKAALLVKNSTTSYLFLDVDNADPDAVLVELTIDDLVADCIENEKVALWLSNRTNDELRVVPHEDFDLNTQGDETGYAIPTPLIIGG